MRKLTEGESINRLVLSVLEDEPTLTIGEVGYILGVTRQTCYNAIATDPTVVERRDAAKEEYLAEAADRLKKYGGRA
jgi:hypothetical protein